MIQENPEGKYDLKERGRNTSERDLKMVCVVST